MKKIISLIFVIVVILIGKWFIDNKTIDYEKIVNPSLAAYYINGDVNELKPIIKLLESHNYDEKLRRNVQEYSFEVINSWYSYLENKYVCTKSNLNSCNTQVDEYKLLDIKLKNLYNYKCKDGFTIILPSAYTKLVNVGSDKIKSLNKIIASPSAKDPKDSEAIRNDKCNKAVCENCREGLCSCIYTDENMNRETLTCRDKDYVETTS